MQVYSTYRRKQVRKKRWTFPARRVGMVLLIFTTAIMIFLRVATWLNAQELFRLKDIEIKGNRFIEASELRDLVHVDSLASLLKFDVQNISNQIKRHPLVDRVSVTKRLPSTLIIKVHEKEPLAILNTDELTAVDKNGNAVPGFRTEMLVDTPIISNMTNNTESLQAVLDFLSLTKSANLRLYLEISEISYSQEYGIYFFLNEQAIPVIYGNGDFENKAAKFLRVWALLKRASSLQTVEYFDLRFKDQVIVKES